MFAANAGSTLWIQIWRSILVLKVVVVKLGVQSVHWWCIIMTQCYVLCNCLIHGTDPVFCDMFSYRMNSWQWLREKTLKKRTRSIKAIPVFNIHLCYQIFNYRPKQCLNELVLCTSTSTGRMGRIQIWIAKYFCSYAVYNCRIKFWYWADTLILVLSGHFAPQRIPIPSKLAIIVLGAVRLTPKPGTETSRTYHLRIVEGVYQ